MFDDLNPETPEQIAAFEALAEAIARYHHAYDDPGLLMDWMLVAHLTDPQVDGSDAHRTALIGSSGQPAYRSLGLLEYASTVVRRNIADAMDGI